MAELADYAVFVAVAEQGSLTAAARQLGRSLPAVSRSLIALESDLGVPLIRRTTRRSRPTEAGLAFLARVRPALAELRAARVEIGERGGRVAGLVRIGGPALFGTGYLTALLASFLARYPEVETEMVLGEAFSDLNADGLDLAVRMGELPDSSLIARRLGSLRQAVFAAPGYLAQAGTPRAPEDLARHRCILRTSAKAAATWTFSREGRTCSVAVSGPFRSDNPAACNEAAALGLGIGLAPLWQVRGLLDAGRLALVLADYELPAMPLHLVRPPGPPSLPVRLLIEHIAGGLDLRRI